MGGEEDDSDASDLEDLDGPPRSPGRPTVKSAAWIPHTTDEGHTYYEHQGTGETSWEPPVVAQPPPRGGGEGNVHDTNRRISVGTKSNFDDRNGRAYSNPLLSPNGGESKGSGGGGGAGGIAEGGEGIEMAMRQTSGSANYK